MDSLRLFIAIKLPQDFIKKLTDYQSQLTSEKFRIAPAQNLHLTLLFIGDIPQNKLPIIKEIIAKYLQGFKPTPITFTNLSYGPIPHSPRLIWLEGKDNNEFNNLKQNISADLETVNDSFTFLPHITLARFKNIPLSNLPELPTPHIFRDYSFTPKSIWLMQSILKRDGPQYLDLLEFNLSL